MKYLNALLVVTVSTLSSPILAGSFIGDPVLFPNGCQLIANQDEHDKKCRLKGELTYISSRNNLVWQTDEWKNGNGSKVFSGLTDGASIPSWARKIIGDKYDESYLKAAIVHDHYCYVENHVRTWQETHKMFYDALIDLKVDKTKAKAMYFAVYIGGPKWGRDEIVAGETCSGDYGSRCTKIISDESIEDSLSDEELEEHIRIGHIWDEWAADEQYDGTYLEYFREKYPEEYFSDARIEDNFLSYVSINKSEKIFKDKKLEKSYLKYLRDEHPGERLSDEQLEKPYFNMYLTEHPEKSFRNEQLELSYLKYLSIKHPERILSDEKIAKDFRDSLNIELWLKKPLSDEQLEKSYLTYLKNDQSEKPLKDKQLEKSYLKYLNDKQAQNSLSINHHLRNYILTKELEKYLVESFKIEKPIIEQFVIDEQIRQSLYTKELEQLEQSLSDEQLEQSLYVKKREQLEFSLLEQSLDAKQQLEEALYAKKQEQLEKYFRDEDTEEALSAKEQEQLDETLSVEQIKQPRISRIDWQEANYDSDEFNKQLSEVQKIIEKNPEIALEELERIAHYRSPIS